LGLLACGESSHDEYSEQLQEEGDVLELEYLVEVVLAGALGLSVDLLLHEHLQNVEDSIVLEEHSCPV
jgi:hypothetical protein